MSRKPKILIVDDKDMICEYSRSVLERTGKFEVSVSTDPVKGLELARELVPDLVFLDLNMPGMDGGEIANKLAAEDATKHIPIVFLTALLRKSEETVMSTTGQERVYLAKPISATELIEAAETYCLKGTEENA